MRQTTPQADLSAEHQRARNATARLVEVESRFAQILCRHAHIAGDRGLAYCECDICLDARSLFAEDIDRLLRQERARTAASISEADFERLVSARTYSIDNEIDAAKAIDPPALASIHSLRVQRRGLEVAMASYRRQVTLGVISGVNDQERSATSREVRAILIKWAAEHDGQIVFKDVLAALTANGVFQGRKVTARVAIDRALASDAGFVRTRVGVYTYRG